MTTLMWGLGRVGIWIDVGSLALVPPRACARNCRQRSQIGSPPRIRFSTHTFRTKGWRLPRLALSSGVIFDAGFQQSEINITSFKCLALITQEAVVSLLAAMVGFQRSPQPSRVRSRLQAGCDRSTTPSCFAALFTSASERRRSGGVGSRPDWG